jgi:glyceraldehyde 3-phosphate dehydrogenase
MGAKKVVISAPSKTPADCDLFLLQGISDGLYDQAKHHIVSVGSCTTNALAPVIKVLRAEFGIDCGFFLTVHAYTNTQSLTDQPKKDMRDMWGAAENFIPSASGAAKSLKVLWPDLNVTGAAVRGPVPTGSIVYLTANLKNKATAEQVNAALISAAMGELQGVMKVDSTDLLVSSAIKGSDYASIVDLKLTTVVGNLTTVAAWYDNEWGFTSAQLARTAVMLAQSL